MQGKPLLRELKGFRSIYAGRYRVIYKVHREKIVVYVLCVGLRKDGDKYDVYKLTKKLIDLRLID